MRRWVTVVLAVGFLATAAPGQTPDPTPPPDPAPTTAPPTVDHSLRDRFFFGGGIGLSFGTIDYVSISPMVGYHVVPRFDVAVQPFYSYTKDGRYTPELSANNYGADLVARVRLIQNFFAEGRYEWISYEYLDVSGQTSRRSDSYPFAGVGYSVGTGRVGIYFSALYNFGYDSNDPIRPYDSPWTYQVGASMGF